MTKRSNRFVYVITLIVVVSLLQKTQSIEAQTPIRKTQQFSSVYFQYPTQFLRNGIKSMVELNINEQYNLGFQLNSIYSYNPIFYNPPGNTGGGSINVQINPNYYIDNSFKVLFKNYISRYSQSFQGYYLGLTAQLGRVRESYYSTLGPNFPEYFRYNTYSYNRYSFIFGRQWTLYNQGVIDFNIGVGYNQMDLNADPKYTAVSPFRVHGNSAYFLSELAFGIGKHTEDQSLPKKPRLRDSLVLDHAVLLDFNAILNSGIELNLYHGNHNKHLWRNYVRVRRLNFEGINITEADSFQSIMVGVQYRHYPSTTRYRNGVYFGYGYAYEHSVAHFVSSTETSTGFENQVKTVYYDPHNLDLTLGFTTILSHKFILDAYVSNILTLSKGRGAEDFPRINDATGFRTELGFKMGFARFRRK
ncbi:MAG: hypothetical protein ACI9JN_002596 [Bacteroidia bacterium]|jgi:hypothetical protein